MVQTWLIHNPLLSWVFEYPVGGIVAVVILVLLFGGLVRAIAQITEQLWVRLLQMPMRAGQWVFTQLLHLLRLKPRNPDHASALSPTQSLPPTLNRSVPLPTSSEQQLCEIMSRLERLQQEQTLLLQDIKTLLVVQQESKGMGKGNQYSRK
jgi:hypothetical protein